MCSYNHLFLSIIGNKWKAGKGNWRGFTEGLHFIDKMDDFHFTSLVIKGIGKITISKPLKTSLETNNVRIKVLNEKEIKTPQIKRQKVN